MSRRSTVQLLEYARWTLQLVEQYPHREEDAHLAIGLESALQRYIAELEQEVAKPVRSRMRIFQSPLQTLPAFILRMPSRAPDRLKPFPADEI